jgi:hypothetical protein
MIIESGIIIFLGLLFLFWKLSWKWRLTLLGNALALDIAVMFIATWVHFGTFTGLLAAAVAGLMCSGFTAGGKWLFGYIKRGQYHPGQWDMSHTLTLK